MSEAAGKGIVKNRFDFLYLFDVKDGNPNGDPDFDNTPRFDPETMQGLVSDVCLKRKIRNYIFADNSSDGSVKKGYDIYIMEGHSLESRQRMPFDNLSDLSGKAKANKTAHNDVAVAKAWMCENFYDIRTFGAVMSTTDFRCGQVRGPVQITFSRSFDRVLSTDHGITRVAYTTEEKKQSTAGETEMGHKHTVAYGLYAAYGFINPNLASSTKFTEADLNALWRALTNMFDFDRSASRGLMTARNLFVFKHDSAMGEAPAHKLFELVQVAKKDDVEVPRAYKDYIVTPLEEIRKNIPSGVSVDDLING